MRITGDRYFDNDSRFRACLQRYEEAVQAGSMPFLDVDDVVDLADYYHITGEFDKAEAIADWGVATYPGEALPLVFKARRALQRGDIPAATVYAEQIADKHDVDYHFIHAELILADGDVLKADMYLRDIYDQIPEDMHSDFALDSASLFSDYEQADPAWSWLMLVDPNTDELVYHEIRGRLLLYQGRTVEAKQQFQQLVDAYPMSENYWVLLACAQDMLGLTDEAVTSAQYALAINPSNEAVKEFLKEQEQL